VLTWQQNLLKESQSDAYGEDTHYIQVLRMRVLTSPAVWNAGWYFQMWRAKPQAEACNAVLSVMGLSCVELSPTELC